MNRIKIFVALLIFSAFLFQSCVKDELFVDTNVDSDVVLVINEVNSNAGDPNPDWIEIYNPGSEAVDISGFGVYDKPAALFTFPAGTIVPAGGYFAVVCDVALAGGNPTNIGAFGISSGGESVFLVDAAGAVIDEVAVPAMPLGVTYARIPDGGTVWSNANATKAAANSNTNEAPAIIATLIPALDDNNYFDLVVTASDAGGVRDVKLYLDIAGDVRIVEMAPSTSGTYKYRISAMTLGTAFKYYVVATDETGKKSYFPATAPATPASLTVQNGAPAFKTVTLSNQNPANAEDVNFTVSITDKTGVKEVRLYYVIGDALAATKTTIILTYDNGNWVGTIPGQADGTKVRYYLRAEDLGGLKTYYPLETVVDGVVTSPFNHDLASTWPEFNVAPAPNWGALVLNEVCGLYDDGAGNTKDWVEFYNTSNEEVDIAGVYLVKDAAATVFTFPAGTKIAANSYIIVEQTTGGLTAGISNTKAVKLELYNPRGVALNYLEKTADNLGGASGHASNQSYARNAAGGWVVSPAHTRGAANSNVKKK